MTKRQRIYKLNAKANERIEWLRTSSENLFPAQTESMIDALFFKTSMLNNISRGKLRIGALNAEDEDAYINAIENFLADPVTTREGQENAIIDKGFKKFSENHPTIEITKNDYIDLVRIWESETFQKFKENFGTYSGVINEMAKSPKEYKKAISFLAGVNRSNKEHGKYATDGELNVKAFITAWKNRK